MAALRIFTFYFLLTLSVWVTAESAADKSLNQQRQLYSSALNALRTGNSRQFNTLTKQLKHYPLLPYLEYAQLASQLTLSKRSRVESFLKRYQGQPVASRLRYRWLKYLRKRDRWQDYLRYYKPGNGTTEQNCYYQLARYRNGQTQQATAEALKLWGEGKSQPKGCDKLFGVLIKDQQITEPVAWQRFTKAVLNHQYQLARYLKRFFTSNYYIDLSDKFYKVDRSPQTLSNYRLFANHPPEVLQVIEHGLTHLARTDVKKALGYWNLYHQTHPFSAKSEKTIITALVKGLYQQQQPQAADTLLKESLDKVDAKLIEWRIRDALSQNNWTEVNYWIQKLPEEYQQDYRWRYWSIRARQAQGKITTSEANQGYAFIAQKRNFYGFLASDRLNKPYALEHHPINVTPEAVATLVSTADFSRIRELYFHKELTNARREWVYATKNLSEKNLLTAAQWATDINWPDRAIGSMIQAGYWDDIDIRFPLPYKSSFEKNAKKTNVPLSLLFALARQESALNPDVTSPAGAKGLIQLMPATAKETAKKHRIPYKNSKDLHNPEINIQLGSQYYGDMLKRFNNKILACAAYNAGPHRVNRWLKDSNGKLPFDAWIETIPYTETRGYVQNVLAFSAIYSHHLQIKAPMLTRDEIAMTL